MLYYVLYYISIDTAFRLCLFVLFAIVLVGMFFIPLFSTLLAFDFSEANYLTLKSFLNDWAPFFQVAIMSLAIKYELGELHTGFRCIAYSPPIAKYHNILHQLHLQKPVMFFMGGIQYKDEEHGLSCGLRVFLP